MTLVVLIAPVLVLVLILVTAGEEKPVGPTTENAMAAEEALVSGVSQQGRGCDLKFTRQQLGRGHCKW
jgi:hypothetical protein